MWYHLENVYRTISNKTIEGMQKVEKSSRSKNNAKIKQYGIGKGMQIALPKI